MKFKSKHYIIGIFVIGLVLFFGILIGSYFQGKESINEKQYNGINLSGIELKKSVVYIPGVDNNGQGVSAILETSIRDGSGFVLVNINNLTAGSSTQDSARLAVRAVKKYLNLSEVNNFDIIYNIKTDAPVIDGPSAGAAMAVSLASLLENKTLNEKVSITGFVDGYGFVGPASGIEQKASALKKQGIEILLVSEQIALLQDYVKKEFCSSEGEKTYCEINYIAGDEIIVSGIRIIQVKELNDTLEYFYKT